MMSILLYCISFYVYANTPVATLKSLGVKDIYKNLYNLEKEHKNNLMGMAKKCAKETKCLDKVKALDKEFIQVAFEKKKEYLEWVHAQRLKNLNESYALLLNQSEKKWNNK